MVAQEKADTTISPVLTIGEEHVGESIHKFHSFGPCQEDCKEGRCNVGAAKVACNFMLKGCGACLHDVQP